jgi:hypothetical protein
MSDSSSIENDLRAIEVINQDPVMILRSQSA